MKTEDGTGDRYSVSQESEKAIKGFKQQVSRLPMVSKINSKQKLAITRKKPAVKSTLARSKTIV